MGVYKGFLTMACVLAVLVGCGFGEHKAPERPAPGYRVLLQWGSAGNDPGQFNGIQGLGVDTHDRIYATDAENCRVQVFDADGQFQLTFGQCGDGPGEFRKPMDVAVDRSGLIYVVDFMLDRVQVFDQQGT